LIEYEVSVRSTYSSIANVFIIIPTNITIT
jgi:hypothetical protein